MSSVSMPQVAGNGLEPGFRGVICASFGAAGDTAEQQSDSQPKLDLHFEAATPQTLSELRSVLGSSSVGVRLFLSGPTADIRAAAAVAAECGLHQEEMTLLSEEAAPRAIYCPHCHSTTPTFQPAGSEVPCQGCGTALVTTDHFSRRMGAYLGYAARVEEAS
ncbi:dimethylamine monooxygenase subunit DmmA family protein [Arthrobacter silvisoli]|uniref:dimethylamine monooxygenase subunit DmmA family protein n=1 Tax=Arthrobacter silvisoli TaxID=2291022 RepID=UPI000E2183E7|nr:dimethylamine monooxygenase subunit DmmA family protein [Arthrobacter silvisoli]